MAERKDVYTIIQKEGLDKAHWVRVGIAFVNRDDSLNIRLDALPVNGVLHVRERAQKPEKEPSKEESSGDEV